MNKTLIIHLHKYSLFTLSREASFHTRNCRQMVNYTPSTPCSSQVSLSPWPWPLCLHALRTILKSVFALPVSGMLCLTGSSSDIIVNNILSLSASILPQAGFEYLTQLKCNMHFYHWLNILSSRLDSIYQSSTNLYQAESTLNNFFYTSHGSFLQVNTFWQTKKDKGLFES